MSGISLRHFRAPNTLRKLFSTIMVLDLLSWARARAVLLCILVGGAALAPSVGTAQSVSSGTVQGTAVDQTDAVLAGATVEIRNPVTGYDQTTTTDANGAFRFNGVPFNNYQVTATYSGLDAATQNVSIRSALPISLKLALSVAGTQQTVTVEAQGSAIETVPTAHSDVDTESLSKLPITTPGAGLSETITMMATGVVNDANGFFHPLGDHSETSFQIDGQPINDQLSKVFSTQLPLNALKSLELLTGFPSAEYGEKTSLVVNATTPSGLGMTQPHGNVSAHYGSFGTGGAEASVGFGSKRFGDYLALNGLRSGRFLDTPEFRPFHDVGNNGSVLDRFDYQPDDNNAFHLDLFAARNWFQIPNTFDQVATNQDQRQRALSYNFAPGYQHTFSAHTLFTLNTWIREDQVNYFPSADRFDDTPVTASQHRKLMNLGGKAEVSYSRGKHNVKVGMQIMQTRLKEQFGLGVTDPTFNAPCDDPAEALPCAVSGANAGFQAGLAPFDLTRGGTLLRFQAQGNIEEYAGYVTDLINWGHFTLNPGLRITHYDGLSTATGVQPRMGLSYLVKRTSTVLRISYARTLETPHNENLLLSSSTGVGGLANVFGAFGAQPLPVGRRNQFNVGFQQTFGRWLQVDADYFWKFTHNAAEFDVLLTTPITFPIMWKKDKLDGLGVRLSTLDIKGFRLNTTIGAHGRLRYFGPEVGGLLFNSPVTPTVFRTDSDDKFYQTTTAQYQWKKNGPWVSFTWRYDNGQTAGAIPCAGGSCANGPAGSDTVVDASIIPPDQQAMAGLFCGSVKATPTTPISSALGPNLCPASQYGATRVAIPAPGTANDDKNPPRVSPRHLFDIGIGTDNLFRTSEDKRVKLQFAVTNLTNKITMYNFLSTFGGTHFVQPRSYEARIGYVF